MSLTVQDLEQLQTEHPDYRMELEDGKIIIMGPSDFLSEEVIAQLIYLLKIWVDPRQLGRVAGSSAGFLFSDSNVRSPDVCFVSAAKLKRSPRYFATVIPDLAVEVKSQSDRIKPLEEKIHYFLSLGVQVGMLIDPDKLTVSMYRSGTKKVVLKGDELITLPELLPGWSIMVSELWPPVFEDED